jgi:ribosomal protein L16/L10AE
MKPLLRHQFKLMKCAGLGCLHAVSVVTFEVGDFSATGDYGLFRQQLFCISSRQLKSRRVSRQQYITQIMKEWKTFSFAHKLARCGLCFLMVRLFKHHASAHKHTE